MDTGEDQDRPAIPSNTELAVLAADVGGMVETAISLIANLGHQVGTLFPALPESDEGEQHGVPRPPVADFDGYIMALELRKFYMLSVQHRVARELNGADVIGGVPSEVDEQLSPDLEGPGSGG